MIILELRPVVKVTVTPNWYATLGNTRMQPHTEFWIPISNNIRICSVHDVDTQTLRKIRTDKKSFRTSHKAVRPFI